MPDGVIIKILGGFYYVSHDGGTAVCRARGRFRMEGLSPLVGDRVTFGEISPGVGVIDGVHERKSRFIRPAVANIDFMVIVASCAVPATDPFLIDRMAAAAAHEGCAAVICVNKSDLAAGNRLLEIYSASGYRAIHTSAVSGEGIGELRAALRGKISALTGNTGVGKSSLLNALCPGLDINTGEISRKLGRGRHTTRHVELFSLGGGTYVADTPGFASFAAEQAGRIDLRELERCFPEFEPYLGSCRFSDCAHLGEPDCGILKAVAEGRIRPERHASYSRMRALISSGKEF